MAKRFLAAATESAAHPRLSSFHDPCVLFDKQGALQVAYGQPVALAHPVLTKSTHGHIGQLF